MPDQPHQAPDELSVVQVGAFQYWRTWTDDDGVVHARNPDQPSLTYCDLPPYWGNSGTRPKVGCPVCARRWAVDSVLRAQGTP